LGSYRPRAGRLVRPGARHGKRQASADRFDPGIRECPDRQPGQAYLPYLARDEKLTVEFAEGGNCTVQTKIDGWGAVTRKIGPFACVAARP